MSHDPDPHPPAPKHKEVDPGDDDITQKSKRQRRAQTIPDVKGPDQFPRSEFSKCFTTAKAKIKKDGGFHEYQMGGAEKACTTVTMPGGAQKKFGTKDNMHSEMGATKSLLESRHLTLIDVGYGVLTVGGEEYEPTPDTFQTDVPHCGYCAIILTLFDLPLSVPTQGKFHFSSHLNYPIPEDFKRPRIILAALFCGDRPAFETFIAREFFKDGTEVAIDVNADTIKDEGGWGDGLTKFFNEKVRAGQHFCTRAEFVWKCFFNYLNVNLKPEDF